MKLPWVNRLTLQQEVDAAWLDGYHYGDAEVTEMIAGKDDFIAEQSMIIERLIRLINNDCPKLFETMPTHLFEQLRSYA